MEALWRYGQCSIRQVQEFFPERERPAYTTIQTTVYHMEARGVLRRIRKIGNVHIFEATISATRHRRLIDELLSLFEGSAQPLTAHLIESGKLTEDDVRAAEKTLHRLARKDRSK